MRSHIKIRAGFLVVSIVILTFLGFLLIANSTYILSIYLRRGELYASENEAYRSLDTQEQSFLNVLIRTNSDGGGYQTDGPGRVDINGDDDDFDGTNRSIGGVADDDGDAFKYRYGVILGNDETNVFALDSTSVDITGMFPNTISKFSLLVDRTIDYSIELYRHSIGHIDPTQLPDEVISGSAGQGENTIDITGLQANSDDLILVNLSNPEKDVVISYRLGAYNMNGGNVLLFLPARLKPKNFDYYANLVYRDQNGDKTMYNKMYFDVLPGGKKPIAPSYLHIEYATGSVLKLGWDINDTSNTGAYFLYRSTNSTVTCSDSYKYAMIEDGYENNIFTGTYDPGEYYYTMCASNGTSSGSFIYTKLSTQSNILKVTRQ